MNIDELTLGQIKEIRGLVGDGNSPSSPFELGRSYLIRTVTMTLLGRLKWQGDRELVLESASWIADTGRFHEFVKGKLSAANVEVEPFTNDVIVGRGAIVDATLWVGDLPKEAK